MPTRRGGTYLRHSSTAKDTSGKYANAAYPQWMRILEDKYQKLHQKIAITTRLNSVRCERNPLIVRDGATSRKSNIVSASVHVTSNIDITDSDDHTGTSASASPHTKKAGDATAAEDENVVNSDVVTATVAVEFKKNGSKIQSESTCDSKFQSDLKCASRFQEDLKDGFTFQNNVDNDYKHQNVLKDASKLHDKFNHCKFHNKFEDCLKIRVLTTSFSEGEITASAEADGKMSRFAKTDSREREVLSRYPPNKFNVNDTATSKDSQYTARSCPAIIQTLKQMGAPPRGSLAANYHRGPLALKSLNMFSKMSSEAQHAVSETLIEMGAERSNSVTTDSSSALDLGELVKISETPRQRPFPKRNSRFLNNFAQRRRGLGTGTIRRERRHQLVESNASTRSSNSSEVSRCTRLPPLINAGCGSHAPPGRLGCVENLSAARHRIPALCKYDVEVFREPTFQITLPDFDIRYRDVLSSERCESETPPLEIREEAIKKCQAWLTKYTNRQ